MKSSMKKATLPASFRRNEIARSAGLLKNKVIIIIIHHNSVRWDLFTSKIYDNRICFIIVYWIKAWINESRDPIQNKTIIILQLNKSRRAPKCKWLKMKEVKETINGWREAIARISPIYKSSTIIKNRCSNSGSSIYKIE